MLHGKEIVPNGTQICASLGAPHAKSRFKYLNSGNIMGRAHALRVLMKDVLSSMGNVNEDDQGVMQGFFKAQNEGKKTKAYTLAINTDVDIFLTAWGTTLASPKYAWHIEPAYFDGKACKVFCMETNVTPAAVHFNGKKDAYEPIARHLQARALNADALSLYEDIKAKYRRFPWWAEICEPVLVKDIDHC
ncbi:hypothetical protein FVE85_4236 [Porphyridium purpureum]|uniref:Uncharacterized protein n=1 Tax=Porphyridium purpureum TaxID=35688 RepID=A0A5J4YRX7_PORPP|nr:hypothetical protein FVE85_4236 [Porphyridium purpureum]|eukprot:POR8330..scf229_5